MFGYCADWPASATDRDRLDWLREHCLRPAAYYVHRVGRTVGQIQDEARLRTEVEAMLDRPDVAGQPSAAAVRGRSGGGGRGATSRGRCGRPPGSAP